MLVDTCYAIHIVRNTDINNLGVANRLIWVVSLLYLGKYIKTTHDLHRKVRTEPYSVPTMIIIS